MDTRAARDRHFHACASRQRRVLQAIATRFAGGADREDLLQEILVALWHALPAFAGQASEATYAYRVALNTALDWRQRRPPPAIDLAALDATADALIDRDPAPEQQVLDAERGQAVARALARLPAIDQSLLHLHLDGLSYLQIGAVLGLSESNVGARLSRARRRLSTLLEERPT